MRYPRELLPVLPILAVVLSSAWGAEGKSKVSLSVVAVQASSKGDPKNPTIGKSLSTYSGVLKRLKYGSYSEIGRASGSAGKGGKMSLSAGGYTVDVTVQKMSASTAVLKYEISKGGTKSFKGPLNLKSGSVQPVEVQGKSPIILLFHRTK